MAELDSGATERLLVGLAAVVGLGIGAQWLAWRLRLPSILLLLVFGFLAGPVSGWLDPEAMFGELLFPIVSLSVGLILFEGGLTLQLAELKTIGRVVRALLVVGIALTWFLVALAAIFVLELELELAVLFGAILVVTGPTVVLPLLRFIRPTGRVGSVIKWEGILNDPVGATLAVLVYESLLHAGKGITAQTIIDMVETLFYGGSLGILGALVLVLLLRRYWIPDHLQTPVTLMGVVLVFAGSNLLQEESGLLAVTVMGVALANQKFVSVKHIVEFKENLRVLLISFLFILLAARLEIAALDQLDARSFVFLALLILAVRPIAVFASTWRSDLDWRERLFVAWMAPRGIVAAAVASLFAIRLLQIDFPGAERLVPLTFLVIVGTITVYGLTAHPLALWLKLSEKSPQGVLFVGAHTWARQLAAALKAEGFDVLLVDSNRANAIAARMDGLRSYNGNILSEETMEDLNLHGIGRLVALTSNREANSLAALHFVEIFTRAEVYQLPSDSDRETAKETASPRHLRGRLLFRADATYDDLSERWGRGATIKTTPLSDTFDFESFTDMYGDDAVPMFLVTGRGELRVFTVDKALKPEAGQKVISMVTAPAESPEALKAAAFAAPVEAEEE